MILENGFLIFGGILEIHWGNKMTESKMNSMINFAKIARSILDKYPDRRYLLVRSNIRDFKLVNQLFGFQKGNEILSCIENFLFDHRDSYAAYGQIAVDQFVILVEKDRFSTTDFSNLPVICSRLITTTKFRIHIQLGIYEIVDPQMEIYSMCDRAKLALKSIRIDEPLSVAWYNESIMESRIYNKKIINEFESALENEDFVMYLQPQANTKGEIMSAEALARWNLKDGTILSPSQFIKILEESELIWKLDLYMWENAAKLLAQWKNDPEKKNLSLSVNISPKDFYYIDIEKKLAELIEKYDISPDKMNVEITESSFVNNPDLYIDMISRLHNAGFAIEIDDFGSGYSSLNMLKNIRADILKLDMGFLHDSKDLIRSQIIIDSIIEMAKRLDMQVISEGVESQEQAAFLKINGCDLFQGFYFSKPVPVDKFETVLKEYNLEKTSTHGSHPKTTRDLVTETA